MPRDTLQSLKESAMRVRVLTVGFLLTSALVSITSLAAIRPAEAHASKVTCVCDHDHKAKPAARSSVRKVVRRMASRPAMRQSGGYYNYGSAGAYRQGEWHGEWRVAPAMGPAAYGPPPGDYGPGPDAYGPPPDAYDEAGLQVDRGGWSGGVGGDPEGGGGGGGFGQIHFGQGGNQENGPTYNGYNQSFQYNPSVATPFRPRLMGGFAPTK
jgi:hypothetical protein